MLFLVEWLYEVGIGEVWVVLVEDSVIVEVLIEIDVVVLCVGMVVDV